MAAIAKSLSDSLPYNPVYQQWISYGKSCVQPGIDYFLWQMGSNLHWNFKGCRVFSPHKVHTMQPTAAGLEDILSPIPFLNSKEIIDGLKDELPSYLARAADADPNLILPP